jgi:hypothetical protein
LVIKKSGKIVGTIENNKLSTFDKTLKEILSQDRGEQPFENKNGIGTKEVVETNLGIVVLNNKFELLAEGYEIE